jgi:putative ABC transport system substrate-binding protein
VIAVLRNPDNAGNRRGNIMQEAARTKGIKLAALKASTEADIDAAFATIQQLHTGGLLVAADAFFSRRREQFAALASRYAIPAVYSGRDFVDSGGLISYATRNTAAFRELGTYAGKILKGAKPADLPVEQPTKFELVVNAKTAKALDLTVPLSVLGRADEVIE